MDLNDQNDLIEYLMLFNQAYGRPIPIKFLTDDGLDADAQEKQKRGKTFTTKDGNTIRYSEDVKNTDKVSRLKNAFKKGNREKTADGFKSKYFDYDNLPKLTEEDMKQIRNFVNAQTVDPRLVPQIRGLADQYESFVIDEIEDTGLDKEPLPEREAASRPGATMGGMEKANKDAVDALGRDTLTEMKRLNLKRLGKEARQGLNKAGGEAVKALGRDMVKAVVNDAVATVPPRIAARPREAQSWLMQQFSIYAPKIAAGLAGIALASLPGISVEFLNDMFSGGAMPLDQMAARDPVREDMRKTPEKPVVRFEPEADIREEPSAVPVEPVVKEREGSSRVDDVIDAIAGGSEPQAVAGGDELKIEMDKDIKPDVIPEVIGNTRTVAKKKRKKRDEPQPLPSRPVAKEPEPVPTAELIERAGAINVEPLVIAVAPDPEIIAAQAAEKPVLFDVDNMKPAFLSDSGPDVKISRETLFSFRRDVLGTTNNNPMLASNEQNDKNRFSNMSTFPPNLFGYMPATNEEELNEDLFGFRTPLVGSIDKAKFGRKVNMDRTNGFIFRTEAIDTAMTTQPFMNINPLMDELR